MSFFIGCSRPATDQDDAKNVKKSAQFKILGKDQTGIDFSYGKSTYSLIEGAGAGVGDFNNDGKLDIFLVGDSLHGLYINKDDLQFKNYIHESGIPPTVGASSVTIWDFNGDGWDDILIATKDKSSNPRYTVNVEKHNLPNKFNTNILLFYNNKNLTFDYVSDSLNLLKRGNFSGASINDINNDGRVDILLTEWHLDFGENDDMLPHLLSKEQNSNLTDFTIFIRNKTKGFKEKRIKTPESIQSDLTTSFSIFSGNIFGNYQNTEAFITNDFDKHDYFLKNEDDSLRAEIFEVNNTTSFFSMGLDVSDINNDLQPDILTADMRPHSNFRQKLMRFEKPISWKFMSKIERKFQIQEVKNTANVRISQNKFSEIGQMLGMDATDWSWSILASDLDNNMSKDLFISNGYYLQELLSYDAPLFIDSLRENKISKAQYLNSDTFTKEHFTNYFFSNNGDLQFSQIKSNSIIRDNPNNTRGAAYGDFDNDGDVDIVANNHKQNAIIYKNLTIENAGKNANYLRVELLGQPTQILNAQLYLFNGQVSQYFEIQPVRGFYSTSEKIAHFGLGGQTSPVDSLIIRWGNGQWTQLQDFSPNQVLQVHYDSVAQSTNILLSFDEQEIIKPQSIKGLTYKYKENDFIDFRIDPLLPRYYSCEGPTLDVGDLNEDKFDDVVIGGAKGQTTGVWLQDEDESFIREDTLLPPKDSSYEDAGIALLDYNQDGLNDLYVASGGFEKQAGKTYYHDRLYKNMGNGRFKRSDDLPEIDGSSSCVKVCDYDGDGDPDLFVGGRVTPQKFHERPSSHLLENDNGVYRERTESLAPALQDIGMVTDAVWADVNQDGQMDLVVVGEYMPVTFLIQEKGQFVDRTRKYLEQPKNGYWHSISKGDFNEDGKDDFIVGNLGMNTRYEAALDSPLIIYMNDFDQNGYVDIISTFYRNGRRYPVKNLQTLSSRVNGLSKRFTRTEKFAKSDVEDIFGSQHLDEADQYKIHTTASVIIESDSPGVTYNASKLPQWAQVGPIMDSYVEDYTGDGKSDVLIIGNFHHAEVERDRYTAMKGFLLRGDGKGNFDTKLPRETGFTVPGEGRSLGEITIGGQEHILATQNDDSLKVFETLRQ